MTDSTTTAGAGQPAAPKAVPSMLVPWLLLIGGASIYGSFFSASKFASDGGVPFIAFTFWQSAIGGCILLTLAAATGNLPRMRRDHLASYAVTSMLGVVMSVIVLAFVASKLQAGVITLAITLTPGITYLFAVMAGVDRWRVLSLSGVALGLAGIAVLVIPEGGLPTGDSVVWVLLLLIVPVCFAANNVFVAVVRPPEATSVMRATGLVVGAAIISFVIMMATEGFYPLWEATGMGLWGVLWAGGINGITFFCMFEIIRRAGPVFFAQYNYVIVIAGLVWSQAIFNEALSTWFWLAFAAMLAGLYFANLGAKRGMQEAAAAG
ncbi:MAG: DMT family transporter [Alphaproteobacteria bacterium]|nr:DMT family transporter [Alphaproteobacteria bacterium]